MENPSQSKGLQMRIAKLIKDGNHFVKHSCKSEATLVKAMPLIFTHAAEMARLFGITVRFAKTASLFECQSAFEKIGGPRPRQGPETSYRGMKPDGGIIFASFEDKEYPILICEDKVQGTNDIIHARGGKRQATGNAIERAGKNIRGAEMLMSGMDIFPYAIFASGCDFHSSETIADRIVMMNYGVPNHYIGITPDHPKVLDSEIEKIIKNITIDKLCGKSIASVFAKAHKYDEMPNGSSHWEEDEIVKICCRMIDLALDALLAPKTCKL